MDVRGGGQAAEDRRVNADDPYGSDNEVDSGKGQAAWKREEGPPAPTTAPSESKAPEASAAPAAATESAPAPAAAAPEPAVQPPQPAAGTVALLGDNARPGALHFLLFRAAFDL